MGGNLLAGHPTRGYLIIKGFLGLSYVPRATKNLQQLNYIAMRKMN